MSKLGFITILVVFFLSCIFPLHSYAQEEQVFYMQLASQSTPETEVGQQVREYMSREWMEQFVSVHGQYMLVFEEADMQREIRDFLRNLTARQ